MLLKQTWTFEQTFKCKEAPLLYIYIVEMIHLTLTALAACNTYLKCCTILSVITSCRRAAATVWPAPLIPRGRRSILRR